MEGRKYQTVKLKPGFQFLPLMFPLTLHASNIRDNLKTYSHPKNELQPNATACPGNPSCSGSPNLCGFLGLLSCHKKFVSLLSQQLGAQMNILGRRLSSTCEKGHFLPPVFHDILPVACTGPYNLFPHWDFQRGCCICNAFPTHWANEPCVAKAACNFLMSPWFMAGNTLLPPTFCSSVKTVPCVSLTLAPAAEKLSLLISRAEPPARPAHTPQSLFL